MRNKDLQLFATKLTERIPDLSNANKQYQQSLRKKNAKSIKQSKIITQQLKTFENQNIVYIKSAIIEHPTALHKLSKIIRQAEKVSQVGSNRSLYNDSKKLKFFQCKGMEK